MSKLYMIIPAYNEQDTIEDVARAWHEILLETGDCNSKLVIIDDGSKDKTYDILMNLKSELPRLEPIKKANSGHGATVLYGYNYALENGADFIFQTDSDGQTEPGEFLEFWSLKDKHNAIIGYRNTREDGFSRVIVTKVLRLVLLICFKKWILDANTPFRLINKETLEKHIKNIPADFNLSNVMLTVSLIYSDENVKFIPITFRPRQGGVNSINLKRIFKIGLQATKDFARIKKSLKAVE